jgi:uncharacterized membrane protein YedE/YeeE
VSLKSIYKSFWNPYVCGVLIASLQIPAYFILKTSLGTSRTFSTLACWVQSLFGQGAPTECLANPKNSWQLGLVIGIIIGAYLAKKLTKDRIKSVTNIKVQPARQAFLGFMGGILFILGAHLGTGCTSGNGISGMSLLFAGSFIVIICMFIGGLITAYLLSRKGSQ